ncbi:MAG: hypothetical protein ACP5US_10970 [Candidatus Kryptoniota bacterium]
MKRVVNKTRSHKDAVQWDLLQQLEMTPSQRQEIARELKQRFYGTDNPDVRESRVFRKHTLKTT